MEVKKSTKADLENKRTIFLEIGLVAVIGLSLLAFNWTSGGNKELENMVVQETAVEQEIIPITRQEEIKTPPPAAPVAATTDFKIVKNDVKVTDEFDFSSDDDPSKAVKVVAFQEKEEQAVAEEEVFFIVEEMPSFQGKGQDGFRTYIGQNLKYPEIAQENGIQGKVFVSFVIEGDGRITNVKVVRGVDPALDKEAVRVVASAPKWSPGKQRNKPVRVTFTFPIIFQLQ
ncbi:energy transducer TonB [Williamwhitmania taraxaci]|uniref:Protein TonB n=1 Tax=Williamwhitmania taraxaci TaxID=1640674 RepID=A0A1G6RDS5_9BACT|nr:energy transducer TonB [Williamwhitmania taraxaci]SDD02782.1 protein TonB [Williamwhitmania taraxaci]